MDTFGEKLRHEREDRGLRIQNVAETLGVDRDRLTALERNDFHALPDEPTMMATLQAYAKFLEVDAELMIEDYVREREHCLKRLAGSVAEQSAEIAPAARVSIETSRPRVPRVLALCAVLAVVLIFGAWWLFSKDGTVPAPSTPEMPETPAANVPVETQPKPAVKQAEVALPPANRPAERSAAAPLTAPSLSIPEFAVGTGVRNRQLVGQRDHFAEGSQVSFWTRVEGGSPGDRIDHVWLLEGVEQLRVSLEIGGPRWRTHSNKLLHPGSAGNWIVEARDASGRVLAHSDFDCTL